MKKTAYSLIAIIFSLMVFNVLFFSSIEAVVYNLSYYKWHYETRHIDADTGMSLEDLTTVTKKMVAYLKDDRDTLDMTAEINGQMEEVFGETEKAHMIDVKKLAVDSHWIRNIAFGVAIALLLMAFWKGKKLLVQMLGAIKYTFAGMFALVLLIGGLLISDFDKYFTIFHEIFFNNDLWLLDPSTDILINMVPEIFFFTTAMLVIVLFALLTGVTIAIAEIVKKKIKVKLR